MRYPKPWKRKQGRSWYVQLNGQQINLGPDRQEQRMRSCKGYWGAAKKLLRRSQLTSYLLTTPNRADPSNGRVSTLSAWLTGRPEDA
jgi:hypothetical protein